MSRSLCWLDETTIVLKSRFFQLVNHRASFIASGLVPKSTRIYRAQIHAIPLFSRVVGKLFSRVVHLHLISLGGFRYNKIINRIYSALHAVK